MTPPPSPLQATSWGNLQSAQKQKHSLVIGELGAKVDLWWFELLELVMSGSPNLMLPKMYNASINTNSPAGQMSQVWCFYLNRIFGCCCSSTEAGQDILLRTVPAAVVFVFVYLCICVFVYLCICDRVLRQG